MMANPFSSAWRSFWHTMTSNDRHATHDSPYRTGEHVPISQNRHAPLTSVATAVDSLPDLSSPYHDDTKRTSISSANVPGSPALGQSPSRPYAPGMRGSMSSPKRPSISEDPVTSEVQLQNFADGGPPPPPVSHSWQKIDRWAENKYEELHDQLGEGCTQNDVNELEHTLDMSLPQDVRESLTVHDGQERGGRPTGIIFGCMLLDCEEIVQEWKNWRTVNDEFLSGAKSQQAVYPIKIPHQGSSSSHSQNGQNKHWRQDLLARQDSQPPNAIQKAYVHQGWVPLARDWGGNNIAIDLAPGPMGKWGQVILFGRDYDCKYVIARSWAHFLAVVADDLCSDKVLIDDESGDLKLKEFKTETVEPPYMEILRWRTDQKYGRRSSRRKAQPPPGLNTNINGQSARSSPYSSPVSGNDERGRSQHRFAKAANGSPRQAVGSPLARVQEESAIVQAGGDVIKDFALDTNIKPMRADKLVDVPSPVETKPFKNKLGDTPATFSARGEKKEFPASSLSRTTTLSENAMEDEGENKENTMQQRQRQKPSATGLGVDGIEDDMKTVAID